MKLCSLEMMQQLIANHIWLLNSESQSYYQKWNAKGFSHLNSFELNEYEQKEYAKYLEEFDENDLTYYSGHPIEDEPGDNFPCCEYQIHAYYIYEVRDYLLEEYGIKIWCDGGRIDQKGFFINVKFSPTPETVERYKWKESVTFYKSNEECKSFEEGIEFGIQYVLEHDIIKNSKKDN